MESTAQVGSTGGGTGGNLELAAEIVAAFVSHNSLPAGELPALLTTISRTLGEIASGGTAQTAAEPQAPAVPVKKSITPDYLISLEDGKQYKSLKRHLARHGLTPEQYRAKWGLPATYPMTAPNYSAQRSELAKKLGLGQQRRSGQQTAQATETKAPRGRKRKAA